MAKEIEVISGVRCISLSVITEGMSSDEKYDVTLSDGRRCMLRISSDGQLGRKRLEYDMLKTAHDYGIPVSCPYVFELREEGKVYQLTQWLDGQVLEKEMSLFSEEEKYAWGVKSGQLLKRMHAIPSPSFSESWKERFLRKIKIRIAEAGSELDSSEDLKYLVRYMTEKVDILDGCEQCFNHGDYHPGNLMHLPDGKLAVIDFNAYNGGYGDPVFETASVLLDRNADEQFKMGFYVGYYGNQRNREAERLLEYYQAYTLLAELCETEEKEQREEIRRQMHVLADKLQMKREKW